MKNLLPNYFIVSVLLSALKKSGIYLLFLFLFISPGLNLNAQSITNYSFTSSAGTFTNISGGTIPPSSGGNADEGYRNGIPIGFDFWYMGVRYTTISASSNGWITLGASISNATPTNNLSTGGANRPTLAPLWDDLDNVSTNNVTYVTTGTSGSRIFTIQYLNSKWSRTATAATISFQVKLYEGTGRVQFVYRPESGTVAGASASIGITATATGSGNFLSLNGSGASPGVSSTTAATNISAKPSSGRTYSFTPPVPAAPTNLTFSSVTSTSMTLNWTDNSGSVEKGFAIYKSTDGANYTFVTQTAANVTSSVQSGLTANTMYYWRVYAVSEGGLSTALSGSRVTGGCTQPAPPTVTTPVSYCQHATAIPLTATGTNLNWNTGSTSGSVGGTATLTTVTFIDGQWGPSTNRTDFTTTASNVTITTLDYTIPAWQNATGLVLSLYNSAGTAIATSSTNTTLTAGSTPVKITNTFNYVITTAGNYSIRASAGYGNIGGDNPAFPITEVSGTIRITGNTPGGYRCFNNIKFTTSGSSTAPTPSTTTVGTTNYTVTQTVGGCTSAPATIAVVVSAPPSTANAGPDQTGAATCGLTTVTLAANAPAVGTGAWSIISGTGGTVTTPTSRNSTFTGTAGSTYTLRWTISNGPCTASTDNVVITFNRNPTTANAGPDQTGAATCGLTTVTLAANTPSVGTGAWSIISGTGGTITTPSSPTSTFSGIAGSTYTLRWTISNSPCTASTDNVVITFNQNPTATISYSGTPYCSSAGTATVTRTGTAGGTYSSTAGLIINPVTGAITLASSAAGVYTVTYTMISGVCTNAATTSVTITALPSATISYSGSPFCKSLATAQPVTQTGTAGGTYSSTAGLSINASTGAITPGASTAGTYTVTYTMAATGGCSQQTATTSVTITALPSATISYSGSPFCTNAGTVSVTRTGTAGGTYSSTAGLTINASTGAVTTGTSTAGTYTVTYTMAAAGGCSQQTATTTLTITALPSATISYSGSPFCTNAGTVSVTRTGTAGGTYSSTAGLTINASTGAITTGTSTPGTYTVTYTMAATGGCSQQTATTPVTITALPAATFSYPGSPYYTNGGTATVSFSGTTGGIFSSTAGLSINSATGAVTLATSTPGTYTVTYTVAATGGCSIFTTTAGITINTFVTKYYVNDNSTSGDVYTSAIGNDANAGTASAPFLTINKAITTANAGDTVYVDAGAYAESVNPNKAITLLGTNAAVSPNTGTRIAESILNSTTGGSMDISTTSRVVVKGFKITTYASGNLSIISNTSRSKITLEKNLFDGSRGLSFIGHDSLLVIDNRFTNIVGATDRTLFIQGDYDGVSGSYMEVYNNTWINSTCGGMNVSSTKADIYNNTFDNIAYNGILVANYSSQNITRNVFTNIYNPQPATNTWGAGVRFYTPAAGMITSITNNYFINNAAGIAVRPTDDVTGRTITISDNYFTGNTFAHINHTGAGELQATCNWFGSDNSTVFVPAIMGNVNYSTFLSSGTDNEPGTFGFQPVPGSCNNTIVKWTGATGTNWNTLANWAGPSPVIIPAITTDILIPAGVTNYPVLNSVTATGKNFTVQSGAALTVNTDGILQIAGTFSNSGAFNASKGSVEFTGALAQTVPENTYFNLSLSGGNTKSPAGNISIKNLLTLGANTTLAIGNNFITLKSDSANTASIDAVPATAAITYGTGGFTIERYVIGKRKYRMITSSVTTSPNAVLTAGEENKSIWGMWQNQGNNATPNAGTIITGGSAADGFDTQIATPSMYTYDPVARVFKAFSTANGKNTKYTPLTAGVPYYLFVYGDRLNTVTTSNPNNTVLTATGKILTGNQVYDSASAVPLSTTVDQYSLVGNPYASAVNWKTVTKSQVTKTIWGWDPNLNAQGGYVTVTDILNGILVSPLSDAVKISQEIQPGQAFFVKTSGSNPKVTIKESDKVNSTTNGVFLTEAVLPLMAINMLYPNGATNTLADGAVVAFDASFSNNVDEDDVKKYAGSNEAVSILKAGTLLTLETKKFPGSSDTLFLDMQRLTKAVYILEVFAKDITHGQFKATLIDKFLNTRLVLSLTDTNRVTVFRTTNPFSYSQDRFMIVFEGLGILPVTFTSVKAMLQNDKKIKVDWTVENQVNISHYTIERSGNGVNFTAIGVQAANTDITGKYSFIDANPLSADNFYRIKSKGNDNWFNYSVIVKVKTAAGVEKLSVYPNPVTGTDFNILLENIAAGTYTIRIIDITGKVIAGKEIKHTGGNQTHIINTPDLAAGYYYVELLQPDKPRLVYKVIKL